MGKKLLLLGGGHAHMVTLANLEQFIEKGHEVTVVGPSKYHYYSGMGPGMLGTTYTASEIRFDTQKVVEKKGGKFLLDAVEKVDPTDRTAHLRSGAILDYDILSFNVGSYVPKDRVKGEEDNENDIFTVKPIEKLQVARDRILEQCSTKEATIAVVGGGPSSAEVAGNILQLTNMRLCAKPRVIIFSNREFMARFPKRVRSLVMDSLGQRGVEIREGCGVSEVKPGLVRLDDKREVACSMIFLALGVKPSPVFVNSGIPTGPDGGMLVNEYLQSVAHPELFGGGDCISFQKQQLDKVGVYAVRQNPILFHNLLASLEGEPLLSFEPGGDYLLIFNLGEGCGVLRKSWLTFGGKPAFLIKDFIDRRFMKKFQELEN